MCENLQAYSSTHGQHINNMNKSQNVEVKAKITRKWKKKYKKKKVSTDEHRRTAEDMNSYLSLVSQQDMSKQFTSDHALDLVGSYPPSQQDISEQFKSDHALDLVKSDPRIQAVINLA